MIRPKRNKYDIVFVNIPSKDYSRFTRSDEAFVPPIGLGSIATYVEKFGFAAGILDADALTLPPDKIVEYLARVETAYVGLNATSENIAIAAKIAERIVAKRAIIGGVHASLAPEETAGKYPFLYAVVHGEGEYPTKCILEGMDLEDVPGIAFKKEKRVIVNIRGKFLDLKLLPIINRKFFEPEGKEFHLISSRGCPYNCTFCASPVLCGRIVRFIPMESVVEEMINAYATGMRFFYFLDDQFLPTGVRAHAFVNELKKVGLYGRISWRGIIRADTILRFDDALLKDLKESGGSRFSLGIEAGSNRILKMVHKKIDREAEIEAVTRLRKMRFEVKGFFVLGFPTETYQEMIDTKNLIMELGKRGMEYFSLATFRPYPGTELYNYLMGQGYKPEEIFYEEDVKEERGLRTDYLHGYYNRINRKIQISQVPNEEIDGLKKEIISEFDRRFGLKPSF